MNAKLTDPNLLLCAYGSGVFPMTESADDPNIFWLDPELRGIFPLDGFHISRSLAKTIRRNRHSITLNTNFTAVVEACADRPETWINDTIRSLYQMLFEMGHAHSIEVWDEKTLVGGVYGVSLGAAFFGESMFSKQENASKIALAYLVDRLQSSGFTLFDTQFLTPHLASLGAVEITRDEYRQHLSVSMANKADICAIKHFPTGQELVHRNTQTS